MSDELHSVLIVAPGVAASAGDWKVRGDGTVIAECGHYVAVLGCPEEDLTEQDLANGALIISAKDLAQAVRDLLPYATAAIGLPRAAYPTDSVILQAEAALRKAGMPVDA